MDYSPMTEKAMAPHPSTLVWKIPWTKEPGKQIEENSLKDEELKSVLNQLQRKLRG